MDEMHRRHLYRILEQFNNEAAAKYQAGQEEHGGELWMKKGLLDKAIEEAIDLVIYLYTLKEQETFKIIPTEEDKE